jgi:hypothetical protein
MSSLELHMVKIKSLGYNIIRVSFSTQCGSPKNQMGSYNAANLDRAIKLAAYYGLWIIIDWHGYHDLEPTYLSCWLTTWKPIVQQFQTSYSQLIWEPENEPAGGTNPSGGYVTLDQLTSGYQQWIDQARSLGDSHYIVVPNICAFTCDHYPSMFFTGWPIIHDPIGHVFINLHTYMYYDYWSTQGWDNATAEKAANMFLQALQQGMKVTGYPALVTEGGTDWISTPSPPDAILGNGGDVSYSKTTLHFAQALVSLFNHNTPRIGWVLWPIGAWASGLYGALDPGLWGSSIHPVPVLSGSINGNMTNLQIRQDLTLTASATGGIAPYSYTWSFGDGSITTGASVQHQYLLGGNYTLTLEVSDSTNVTSISQSQIFVNVPPSTPTSTPVITVQEEDKVVNVGVPVHFSVSAYSSSPRLIVLSAMSLPEGANFTTIPGNPTIGNFSWTPSSKSLTGLYNVLFRAQESGSASFNTKSVTIQLVSSGRDFLASNPTLSWSGIYALLTGSALLGVVSLAGFMVFPAYRPRPKIRFLLLLLRGAWPSLHLSFWQRLLLIFSRIRINSHLSSCKSKRTRPRNEKSIQRKRTASRSRFK